MNPQDNLLPLIPAGISKAAILKKVDESVTSVLEDGRSPLKVAEQLAAIELFIKEYRRDDRFLQYTRDELLKHNGRFQTESGATIEACEAGVDYDYSHDIEWRRLKANVDSHTELLRDRESLLRKVAPGKEAVDPETGEIIVGAMKKSKSTYRVTLAKK